MSKMSKSGLRRMVLLGVWIVCAPFDPDRAIRLEGLDFVGDERSDAFIADRPGLWVILFRTTT